MARGQYLPFPIVIVAFIVLFVMYVFATYPSDRSVLSDPPEKGVYVQIANGECTPSSFSTKENMRVVWINNDMVDYTLSFADGELIVPHGGSASRTFRSGVYAYSAEETLSVSGRISVSKNI